ncbi:hypothetical protein, partial [Clostridium botulinum]
MTLKEEELKNTEIDENPNIDASSNDMDLDDNLIEEVNNEIKNELNEEDQEEEKRWPHRKDVALSANCRLEMHVNPENEMVYVCPGKIQYFLASSSKCCGKINVKYLGHHCLGTHGGHKCIKVYGKLGKYLILDSGIVFIPYRHIQPGCIDILPFIAYDG